MKRKKNILKKLSFYPFFNKEQISAEVKNSKLSKHSVDAYLKSHENIRLKNDFYISKEIFQKNK